MLIGVLSSTGLGATERGSNYSPGALTAIDERRH